MSESRNICPQPADISLGQTNSGKLKKTSISEQHIFNGSLPLLESATPFIHGTDILFGEIFFRSLNLRKEKIGHVPVNLLCPIIH